MSQVFLRKNTYYLYYIGKTEHKVSNCTDEEDDNMLATQKNSNSVLSEKLTLSKYMA